MSASPRRPRRRARSASSRVAVKYLERVAVVGPARLVIHPDLLVTRGCDAQKLREKKNFPSQQLRSR
eukprot:1100234-Pyramimonas_sp.AAC.1